MFVVGCSHAFGVGVAEELTWPNVFCRGFAEHYGLSAAGRNPHNFSQGAASNNYITRVILTQCAQALREKIRRRKKEDANIYPLY